MPLRAVKVSSGLEAMTSCKDRASPVSASPSKGPGLGLAGGGRSWGRGGGVAVTYPPPGPLRAPPAALPAAAGPDIEEYRRWLLEHGVDCRGLVVVPDEQTATGFTTTDLDDNQITGYYGGAMLQAGRI